MFDAGGIHLNSDGTAWVMGGTLFFDGESLGPVDPELIPRQTRYFAPNGEIWVLVDRRLQVITPEAVVGAE
jgi:hypothetical protein